MDRIFEVIAETAPEVRAGLPGRREYETDENPSGEQVLAADVHADELLAERLLDLDAVASYGSEERDDVVEGDGGEYHVACDPLDGSSNLKSNNVMGTIAGVYEDPLPASGRSLVAAAYVCYGPITTMMVARDGSVTEYLLENGDGESRSDSERASGERSDPRVEQRPVDENVTLPEDPVVYGFGGRVPDWPADFESFAREIEQEFKLRYGGAMIGDVGQVMEYGGIFAYPALESAPNGKLRLQFEANPIAYIVESAGGRSSDGSQSLLEVDPEELHQRVPVHVGNEDLVDRLETALD